MNDLKLDIVFKFVFCDPKDNSSMFLLRLMIENTISQSIGSFSIKNTDILLSGPDDKSIRYDIRVNDELGREFDIEMQNTSLSIAQVKRFSLYGARLVDDGVFIGDEYKNMKPKIQIILINDTRTSSLVRAFDSRDENGSRENTALDDKDVPLLRFYIYMPYINVIADRKGIDNLSDYELMIYMIYNGVNEEMKKRKERKIIRMIERKLQQFNEDPILKERAFNRAVQLMIEREEKDECFQDGKKEGKEEGFTLGMEEGKEKGKSEMLMSIIQSKYPNEDIEWIKECDDAQLNYIQKTIFLPMRYEEFYQKIIHHVS